MEHITTLLFLQTLSQPFFIYSPNPKLTLIPKMEIDTGIKCWCERNPIEYVSMTTKNPGRRFLKCGNRVRRCRFWQWIDDPLPLLVRFLMDSEFKKSKKKVRILCVMLFVCFVLILVLISENGDDCNCIVIVVLAKYTNRLVAL